MKSNISIRTLLLRLGKILFWVMVVCLILMTSIILLLQTSPLQNYISQQIIKRLSERSSQRVSLDHVKVKWFDHIEIYDFEVDDHHQKPLIRAKSLEVNFDLFDVWHSGMLSFNDLKLDSGQLNLQKYNNEEIWNINVFVDALKGPKSADTTQTKKGLELTIDHVMLKEVFFSLNNNEIFPSDSAKIDYRHLNIEIQESEIFDFNYEPGLIDLHIASLSGVESRLNFVVQDLTTDFVFSTDSLIFNQTKLASSLSHVVGDIAFRYHGTDDLSSFVDSVQIDAFFEKSTIDPRDLSLFANIPNQFGMINFSGKVRGKIGGLVISDMDLGIGNVSHIKGSITTMGLPKIEETFIDFKVEEGKVLIKELKPFVSNIPIEIRRLNEVTFKGDLLGFIHDFVANGEFSTSLGKIKSDLNLKYGADISSASYSGRLALKHFHAGRMFGVSDWLGRVNFDGKIKGKGLTEKKADFKTEAEITNTTIRGYKYKKIIANGRFAKELFDGFVEVDDPHAKASLRGNVDLSVEPEIIQTRLKIDSLDLFALGFVADSLLLSTEAFIDLHGINPDSLISDVRIYETNVRYNHHDIHIDTATFATENQNGSRLVSTKFPEFSIAIKGDFLYSQLMKDWKEIYKRIEAQFDPEMDPKKLYQNNHQFSGAEFDFSLLYGDLSKYYGIFKEPVYLAPNGEVEGEYHQRKNAFVALYSEIDSLHFNGMSFSDNIIDATLSKDLDSVGIVSVAYITSKAQKFGRNIPYSSGLNMELVWENNHVDLSGLLDQNPTNTHLNIKASAELLENRLEFRFAPSEMMILGNDWEFNPYNEIIKNTTGWHFRSVELYEGIQKMSLKGKLSDVDSTALVIRASNVGLELLNTITAVKFGGTLNGDVHVNRPAGSIFYQLGSGLSLDSLVIDGYFVGNARGASLWESEKERLAVDYKILREGINTIDFGGYFYPNEEEQLNFKAKFQEASIRLLSPFTQDLVSNLSGTADGQIEVSGRLTYPVLNGYCLLNNAKFKYDYLGCTYTAFGEVGFDNQSIQLNDLVLQDRDAHRAEVVGRILHSGFKDFRPDVRLNTQNFMFLNTTASKGEIYYGTVYASGVAKLSGTFHDLLISTNLKSEKNTKMFISLEEDNTVEQKDYISFVNLKDSIQVNQEVINEAIVKSLKGVRLNFDMELTSDAYVELIFDLRAGDIIRGSAEGNLNLLLDTNGEFELMGSVSVVEGAYNFTYSIKGATLLSKEFKVEPGGTITWFGDPYKGILDLKAQYRQLASLSDYQVLSTDDNSASRKVPVLVVLGLKGEMLSPSIDFEIKLEDAQSLASNEEQVLIYNINNNEQELKKQVFSLLVLRKFTPENEFAISPNSTSGVSEFISNQISYYVSQVNENLEFDLDLASMTQEGLNTLQMRLSYTFLDGRLKVSGGGGFTDATTQDGAENSFVGDWAIQYLLTQDGRLVARAFSETNQLAGILQRETGASLKIIKSFDDLEDLLPRAWREARNGKPEM